MKKLKTLEEKRIPTSRSIIKNDQSMQMSISHIMKEDEGQFTLEDSKVRPGTSELSSKLFNDFKQIINV